MHVGTTHPHPTTSHPMYIALEWGSSIFARRTNAGGLECRGGVAERALADCCGGGLGGREIMVGGTCRRFVEYLWTSVRFCNGGIRAPGQLTGCALQHWSHMCVCVCVCGCRHDWLYHCWRYCWGLQNITTAAILMSRDKGAGTSHIQHGCECCVVGVGVCGVRMRVCGDVLHGTSNTVRKTVQQLQHHRARRQHHCGGWVQQVF